MFSKPLNEITFAYVENFCKEFTEGVRVEYKSDFPDNIPKTISAFANTMGGIMVIGVKTDENNKPIFPLAGIPKQQGIEEKIQSSSLQGIYPPVLPDVRIIEIPDKDKVLVVVKISESIEAPHAIQNKTRIYIRTGSQSSPYDLADIDRIEYFLKRREKPREFKEKLITQAKDRMKRLREPVTYSAIEISICPTFPYRPLIPLERIPSLVSDIPTGERHRHIFGGNFKRITNGIVRLGIDGSSRSYDDIKSYSELNDYGLIFHSDSIELSKSKVPGQSNPEQDSRITFPGIIREIGISLKFAEYYFRSVGFLGNLEITSSLLNIRGRRLIFGDDMTPHTPSIDNQSLSHMNINAEEIASSFEDHVERIVLELSWVFEEGREDIITVTRETLNKLWPS